MNKVAIVTGANGFIGINVTRILLEKGYYVYAIVTQEEQLNKLKCDNLKIVSLTFEHYNQLPEYIKHDEISFLIHCAWQGVWGRVFNDYELQMKNAVYAGKTFEIAKLIGTKKYVFLSTANVLETKKIITSPFLFTKLRSTTNYAMAKISAEMICRTLASQYEMQFNCAYISMVYGEGNYSMMVPNVVMLKLLNNESPDLIEGNGLYDLVYVDDVARGLIAIAEYGVNFKSYYLGSRKLQSFRTIFQKTGQILNPNIPLNFGAYPDSNYIDYSLVNLDELYEDTGFETSADFELNIRKTAQWLKENIKRNE